MLVVEGQNIACDCGCVCGAKKVDVKWPWDQEDAVKLEAVFVFANMDHFDAIDKGEYTEYVGFRVSVCFREGVPLSGNMVVDEWMGVEGVDRCLSSEIKRWEAVGGEDFFSPTAMMATTTKYHQHLS